MNFRRLTLVPLCFFALAACTVQQTPPPAAPAPEDSEVSLVQDGDLNAQELRTLTRIGTDQRVVAEWKRFYSSSRRGRKFSLFETRDTNKVLRSFYAYSPTVDTRLLRPGIKVVVNGSWSGHWVWDWTLGYVQIQGYRAGVTIENPVFLGRVKSATDTLLTVEFPRQENYTGTQDPSGYAEIEVPVCPTTGGASDCFAVSSTLREVGSRVFVRGIPVSATSTTLRLAQGARVFQDSIPLPFKPTNGDANGDGRVTAADSLVVINAVTRYLSNTGLSSLDLLTQRQFTGIERIDMSGDNRFTDLDLLLVSQNYTRRQNADVRDLFHNAANPRDVNGDGTITASDQLALINANVRLLPTGVNSVDLGDYRNDASILYIDVNADGRFTPLDVLLGTGN